jgi:hypothetical protein
MIPIKIRLPVDQAEILRRRIPEILMGILLFLDGSPFPNFCSLYALHTA